MTQISAADVVRLAGLTRKYAKRRKGGRTALAYRGFQGYDNRMDIKQRPNHRLYIETLRRMSAEQRLQKSFELTEFSRALFRQGLARRFPELSEDELHRLFLARLEKCHNRNY